MPLSIVMPLVPMEAQSVADLPEGEQWQFEPKWDGFRCIVFREDSEVSLQSKAGQPLARYFPELVAAVRAVAAPRFVLDCEILIPAQEGFSFDALLQRVHPAASRVKKLSLETPAVLLVFDLLAGADGASLLGHSLDQRRAELEKFAGQYFEPSTRLHLSPVARSLAQAQGWLAGVGGALDGVVAKRRDLPYCAGERTGMQKIKNFRSADCVVGGFRYGKGKELVGSLLLGLYDEAGLLNHVGFTSSIKAADKPAVTQKLEALVGGLGFTGSAPGGPSRWAPAEERIWKPLQTELVVEVSFDHFTGGRFRHGTKLLRWRPDKAVSQCTMDQVHQKAAHGLELLPRLRATRSKAP